jgi:hypothetical protein
VIFKEAKSSSSQVSQVLIWSNGGCNKEIAAPCMLIIGCFATNLPANHDVQGKYGTRNCHGSQPAGIFAGILLLQLQYEVYKEHCSEPVPSPINHSLFV